MTITYQYDMTKLTKYYITFIRIQQINSEVFQIFRKTLERRDFKRYQDYYKFGDLHTDFFYLFTCEHTLLLKAATNNNRDKLAELKALQKLLDASRQIISLMKLHTLSDDLKILMLLDFQVLIARRDLYNDAKAFSLKE